MENIDNIEIDKKRDSIIESPTRGSELKLKLCAHCGEEIPITKTKFKTRKFCSVECNRRFFSLQRYHKIKNTEEYKSYRKEYYKKWLDKNRDKFNASMRKASLKYQKKKKEEREKEREMNPNIIQETEIKVNEEKEEMKNADM